MQYEEEKLAKGIKITFLFLITLLGMSLTSKMTTLVALMFYIAFVKE